MAVHHSCWCKFTSPHAAALAFTFVAKALGANQPKLVRERLKAEAGGSYSIQSFRRLLTETAREIKAKERPPFTAQYVDEVPMRDIFVFRPRESRVLFHFEKSAISVMGEDDDAKAFRAACAKLNSEGLEASEVPPPPDPQMRLFGEDRTE